MSTNSYILIEKEDKKIEGIYCHYDGYLSYNGKMLKEHYNSEEKAQALVNLGGISSFHPLLAPECEDKHTWDDPAENVTIAYHRDRGEKLKILEANSIAVFFFKYSYQEYHYLWRDGQWWYSTSRNKTIFSPLSEVNFAEEE